MRKQLMFLLGFVLLLLAGCGGQASNTGQEKVLSVAVASSLEPVVKRLAWSYEAEHRDVKIKLTVAASGELTRRIEQGSGFDLFLSAGTKEMNQLVEKNLVEKDSIADFLSNRLVIVVPEGHPVLRETNKLKDPEFARIAIGDPAYVPAGRYAKQALEKWGIWQDVQSKLVFGNSVRNVLSTVAEAKAEAGIVYRSDAVSEDKVHVAMEIDEKLHEPIRYPMAVLKGSNHPDTARDFLMWIQSPKGKEQFARAAFQVER